MTSTADNAPTPVPRRVEDVDWGAWRFTEDAVLCFVREGSRVLLIHKKTGLGKGKINAPGGRIDKGETAEQAAVRELQEEVGVTPSRIEQVGELRFIFVDGYSLRGHVFVAHAHTGTPHATDEADPFWCDVDRIPYDQMWADDAHWLPIVLAGGAFTGSFIFDEDKMLSWRVEEHEGGRRR